MKMKNIMPIMICFFLLTLLINPITFSSFSSDGNDVIILNYSFEVPEIKEISINDNIFSHVSISSCEQSEPPGAPSLPIKTVTILLPPHSSVKSINVERNNLHAVSNVKNIELGPSVLYPLGEENNIVLSVVDPDNNLYTIVDADDYKDNFIPKYDITRTYPESYFVTSGIQYKRGFPILILNLYPVQHDTLSHTITYCTSMTVKVNLEENYDLTTDSLYRGTIVDKVDVMDLVDNPSMMSLYSSQFSGAGGSLVGSTSTMLSTQRASSNMLIITTEKLKNVAAPYNLQALADAHKRKDMDEVYIETVESIYNHYQVDSCPVWATFITDKLFNPIIKNFNGLKIRECIRDYYLHNNVDYVLLVGDDDYNWKTDIMFLDCPPKYYNNLRDGNKADQNEIPTFQLYLYSHVDMWAEIIRDEKGTIIDIICHLNRGSYVHVTTASDLPYACLDNESTLAFPSHPGGNVAYFPDLYSEVSVGRAPVSNENDLRNFVKKTISYIQASPDQYNKVLMAGEFLGFGGVADFADDALKELINSCNNHGYTTVGIPSDKYNIQTLSDYDEDNKWDVEWPSWPGLTCTWKWFGSDLISCVNNDSIGYINHIGHADINGTMKLGTPEYFQNNIIWERDLEPITGFNNTYYPIVYSQGCFCAAFDSGSPFYSDCIAEYLTVKTNNAAVAFIGNTFFGFGERYSTDGPSQRYNRQFIDAIFDEGKTRIGDANQDSKEDNINSFDDQRLLWLYYCINLLGDPAIKFKISGENELPVADAGGPYSGNVGQTINFDGSASTDDGEIESYNWDFGDGTVGAGNKPSHSYSNTGTYTVSLTVTDDENAIDSATAKVTITSIPVNNHPPLVSDESPENGSSGLSIDIDSLSVFISDPDGDAFDWSIQTSPNIGSADGFGEHNGTKTMVITGELQYNTTYKWYANVSDDTSWTKTIYTFTTKNKPDESGEIKVDIFAPTEKYLYLRNRKVCPLFTTLIISSLEINATITDTSGNVITIKFIIDDKEVASFSYNPSVSYYSCTWNEKVFFKRVTVKILAVDAEDKVLSSDEIKVLVLNMMLKKT